MTRREEKKLVNAIKLLLGEEVWLSLSKTRRLMLILLIEQLSFQLLPSSMGLSDKIDLDELEKFAKEKQAEIDGKELLALINNKVHEWPELGVNNQPMTNQIFQRLRKNMEDFLKKLTNLKFEKKVLQKRHSDILDAINNRISIPGDALDLYILGKAAPEMFILPENEIKEIEEWLKEQE